MQSVPEPTHRHLSVHVLLNFRMNGNNTAVRLGAECELPHHRVIQSACKGQAHAPGAHRADKTPRWKTPPPHTPHEKHAERAVG
jgi:hypothetical protein